MIPKISIIYSTNRVEPKLKWFFDSLFNQTNDEEREFIEIIIVRYPSGTMREDEIEASHKFPNVTVVAAKDSLYSGKGRKTKTEMFSASSARNTGIILSSGEYLVFVDDVSVLMPGWWAAVWQGYVNKRITCGSYWKHFEMDVANGVLVSSRAHDKGRDSRWTLPGADRGPVLIQGTQLFGCSFAIPASDIIQVNGFDELCDSIGGEDYQLGVRLNNAGKKIFYDRSMYTVESEELHDPAINPYRMLREDRLLDFNEYSNRLYTNFSVHKRIQPQGRTDSSHMILDILYGTRQTQARYNYYSLEECRALKKIPAVPDIEHHWFDEKALAEI